MVNFNIESKSGEQFTIGGQVTKPIVTGQAPPWPNYPTTATGFTLRFGAKRRKSDATLLVDVTGTLANGGAWTVTITAAATTGFTKTEELAFEVVLIEPDSTKTVVSEGTWEVEKSVVL